MRKLDNSIFDTIINLLDILENMCYMLRYSIKKEESKNECYL